MLRVFSWGFSVIQNQRGSHAKCLLIAFVCLLSICLPLSAQEKTPQYEDFWICPGVDISMYGPVSVSSGGSLSIAYGNRTSIGAKVSWQFDNKGQMQVFVLEALFRVYFFASSANSGLFAQLSGGPAIYFYLDEKLTTPTSLGLPSIGLTVGWRFLFGKLFFVEPTISGGYPFIAGAGLSAGVRF